MRFRDIGKSLTFISILSVIAAALCFAAVFCCFIITTDATAAADGYYTFTYPEGFDISTMPNYDESPIQPGYDFKIVTTSGSEINYDGVTFEYATATEGVLGEKVNGLPTDAGEYVLYIGIPAANGVGAAELTVNYEIKRGYDFPGLGIDFELHGSYGETLGEIWDRANIPEYDTGYLSIDQVANPKSTVYAAGERFIRLLFNHSDPNYYTLNFTCKLIIDKIYYDMSGVSFDDVEFTYDGEPKSIAVSGTLPPGLTVEYVGNDVSAEGTHTVTAIFIADVNHVTPEPMTATITIVKEPVTALSGGEIAAITIGSVLGALAIVYCAIGIAVYKKKVKNDKILKLYPFIKGKNVTDVANEKVKNVADKRGDAANDGAAVTDLSDDKGVSEKEDDLSGTNEDTAARRGE